MRYTCRLFLGIAVFFAVVSFASAQEPVPPPLPPLPQAMVTPAPAPPDTPPTADSTAATPSPTKEIAPDSVVTTPAAKAPASPARKPVPVAASKRSLVKPTPLDSESQARVAAAAAAAASTNSPSSPPPAPPDAGTTANVVAGTASLDLSKKPQVTVSAPAQAELDNNRAGATDKKSSVPGSILLGVGLVLLVGLVAYTLRKQGKSRLPPIFDGRSPAPARSPLVSGRRL